MCSAAEQAAAEQAAAEQAIYFNHPSVIYPDEHLPVFQRTLAHCLREVLGNICVTMVLYFMKVVRILQESLQDSVQNMKILLASLRMTLTR